MDHNMENTDFHTLFTVNFTAMASTEMKLIFEFLDPLDTLSKVALFFEKIHNLF